MLAHSFIRSKTDACLYIHSEKPLLALIYVDDIIGFTTNDQIWENLIHEMEKELKINNLGNAKWLLGMSLTQNNNRITINQEKYVKQLLLRHHMENCKPAKTPMVPVNENQHIKEEEARKEIDPKIKEEYLQIVGGLIYLSVISRPDIAYAVSKLGQYMNKPSSMDLVKAKRVLRYLQGTMDLYLNYLGKNNKTLIGYSDSDWAGNYDNRRSMSGFIFTLGGTAVSWSSKTQPTVALSSAEAEYIAIGYATQEAMFLRSVLEELNQLNKESTRIYVDNQSSIKIATNQTVKNRTKHIAIKFHFVKEKVENNEINLKYLPTEDMLADIFTKPVGQIILRKSIPKIFGINYFGNASVAQH
jgi:hypothetical protein